MPIWIVFLSQWKKRGAYVNQELLAHLKVAKHEIIRLGWQEDSNQPILYPGSNSDRTMTEVFGNQVVHIDPDDKALALLQKKGFPTEQMTIEDYVANMSDGEKIGIILSYNAGLVPGSALERLQEGGIILANNWYGSADDLHSKKGLELIGAVVQGTEDFVTGPTAENLLGMQCFVYSLPGPDGRPAQRRQHPTQQVPEPFGCAQGHSTYRTNPLQHGLGR